MVWVGTEEEEEEGKIGLNIHREKAHGRIMAVTTLDAWIQQQQEVNSSEHQHQFVVNAADCSAAASHSQSEWHE